MTIDEFFDELKRISGFRVEGSESFRRILKVTRGKNHSGRKIVRFCPITAVAYKLTGVKYSTGEYYRAAKHLGLPESSAKSIAYAADGPTYLTPTERLYRKRLLETLKLTEHA